MGQVQSEGSSVAPGCAVGRGEPRWESRSRRWRCSGQSCRQVRKRRGRCRSLSPGQQQQRCPLPQHKAPALLPAARPGAGGALAMPWAEHQELLPAAPQHGPNKVSFAAPSVAAALNRSPGTSDAGLCWPRFLQGGSVRSQPSPAFWHLEKHYCPVLVLVQCQLVAMSSLGFLSVPGAHSAAGCLPHTFLCNLQ